MADDNNLMRLRQAKHAWEQQILQRTLERLPERKELVRDHIQGLSFVASNRDQFDAGLRARALALLREANIDTQDLSPELNAGETSEQRD